MVACFVETICHGLFEHLLIADFIDKEFFGSIFTYFNIIKTKSWGILLLHYLIWLYSTFYISKLYNQLQTDSKYTTYIIELINCIIRYFIIFESKT